MGTNRRPVEDCASICSSHAALKEAAANIALNCDGAVFVTNDGTIKETMVRIKQLSTAEREQHDSLPYAGWMGARYKSSLETSTREAIRAAITFSEEDGRVTVFTDGTFEDQPRHVLKTE